MRGASILVLVLGVTVPALAGCTASPAQREADRIIAATRSCGDYARQLAVADCAQFSGHFTSNDPQNETVTRVQDGLHRRWDTECAAQHADIAQLTGNVTAEVVRSRLRNGQSDGAELCPGIIDQALQAFPALNTATNTAKP